MKIALIGPGELPIPPEGWGGTEHLMWNYNLQLKNIGHEVVIFNTKDLNQVIQTINDGSFDVAHLHYDVFSRMMPHLNCPKKLNTSHYPFLDNPEPGYEWIYDELNKSDSHIIALSNTIKDEMVRRGAPEDNVSILPCGIDTDSYAFDENDVLHPDKSIMIGKIVPRKRQSFVQKRIDNVHYVGIHEDPDFDGNDPGFLGEQSKKDIQENLTAYANMLLLSTGEAHAFVGVEALAAGLGLVVSEQSVGNLDLNQPFITVIPDDKLEDVDYLREKVEENKKVSLSMRKEIRQYCYDNFDWRVIINKYISIIDRI